MSGLGEDLRRDFTVIWGNHDQECRLAVVVTHEGIIMDLFGLEHDEHIATFGRTAQELTELLQ